MKIFTDKKINKPPGKILMSHIKKKRKLDLMEKRILNDFEIELLYGQKTDRPARR